MPISERAYQEDPPAAMILVSLVGLASSPGEGTQDASPGYLGQPQVHLPTVPCFSAFSQESQQKAFPSSTLQSQPLWAQVLVSGIGHSSSGLFAPTRGSERRFQNRSACLPGDSQAVPGGRDDCPGKQTK